MSQSSSRRSVLSAIASVSVGKPAMRSAPMAMSGRALFRRCTISTACARLGGGLLAFRVHVVARREREVKMRREAGLAGEELEQPRVDFHRVERGEAQALQAGDQRQYALD